LGKRARIETVEDRHANEENSTPVAHDDESEDDDVGPMPLPLGDAASKLAPKKRKSMSYIW
jgi:hypothetical protein